MDDGRYDPDWSGWVEMPILMAEMLVTATWRLYGGLDLLWWLRR